MKNTFKKISMSIIAGTIILGSITSVGAESFSYKTNYKGHHKNFCTNKYHKHNNHKNNDANNNVNNNTKPSAPTNNNTTQNQNNQDKNDEIQNTSNNASSIQSEVLRLVNIERSKVGLSSLKLSNELSSVATKKSQDMADNNYFSHTSPTYGSPFDMMKQFGIKYTNAGENIAQGYSSAEAVMNGWMNSPGHKANILSSDFGTLGVGYVNKGGTTYWTQMFTN